MCRRYKAGALALAGVAVAAGVLNDTHPAGLTEGLEIAVAGIAVLCAGSVVALAIIIWRMHAPSRVEQHLATHPAHR